MMIAGVVNAMFVEASLPDRQPSAVTKGEAALNELHCAFQRDIWSWGEQKVYVIGHEHEGVQVIFFCCSIVLKDFQEEMCVGF